MIKDLLTKGRELTMTRLTGATKIRAIGKGGLREADVPAGLITVSVMERLDGRWYAETKQWAGTGETPFEAVVHAFGKVA